MTTITELEVGRVVGAPLERKEDAALLTGQAKFVDDMSLPGMVWMAVVRSPYAHARIAKVNVDGALAHRGVVAAFSGEELAEEWQASLPCAWLPTEDTNQPNHRPLAVDEARYDGDGVYEPGRPGPLGRSTARYTVVLRHGDMVDGHRCFDVSCYGESRMMLTEPALQTFIGRKLEGV